MGIVVMDIEVLRYLANCRFYIGDWRLPTVRRTPMEPTGPAHQYLSYVARMKYHLLGKSKIEISEIGFGCMSLLENEEQNQRLIHRALDLGIQFFDTADLYQKGNNEKMLGKILKGRRQQVIMATKAGNQWRQDGSGWDWNPGKAYILQAAEASLKRLQTDYIDLYQLHCGTIDDNIDDTIEAFELLKAQGKIREYGISSIRPNLIREYVSRSGMSSVMMQYSLLDRRPEETCLPLLKAHNIGVLARGALAQGLLAGKPTKQFLNFNEIEVKQMVAAIGQISGPDRTPAQTALHFVLQNPAIHSAVIGIRTIEQLEEVANVMLTPPLSMEEIEFLQLNIPAYYYELHR